MGQEELKKHVLVVDDEEDILFLLQCKIERMGYKVSTAKDGEEALRIFEEQNDFSLVISDVRMPGLYDGIMLLEEIKTRNKDIPVILITGFADVSQDEAMDKGAFGFVRKPFDSTNLYKMIEDAIKS